MAVNKKATKAQVIERVSQIKSLLLEGKARSSIQQFAAINYQLTERVIDEYIARATLEIKEMSSAADRTLDLGILLERLYKMANEAEKKGDQKTASSILMNIAKLKGLDQQTINHIVQDSRELETLTDSDLDSLLNGTSDDQH